MKTYIYYYRLYDKTYSMNLKASGLWEALDIEEITGMELMGELIESIDNE